MKKIFLVALIVFVFLPVLAYAGELFPNKPVEQIENWEQYHDLILKIVLEKMNIKYNPNIPKPIVLQQKDFSQEKFNEFSKFEFDAMFPRYFTEPNVILVTDGRRLDTLAHEFVHYVQVKYRGDTAENDTNDLLEQEACRIQHWFEENFLEK